MGKLKSRKFWIVVALAAYGAIMGIKALGVGDQITTIVCIVAAIACGIAYVFAEALVDASGEIAEEIIEDDEEVEG